MRNLDSKKNHKGDMMKLKRGENYLKILRWARAHLNKEIRAADMPLLISLYREWEGKI
jgi:hypothetical protein